MEHPGRSKQQLIQDSIREIATIIGMLPETKRSEERYIESLEFALDTEDEDCRNKVYELSKELIGNDRAIACAVERLKELTTVLDAEEKTFF